MPVIPVVVYHGDEPWRVGRDLRDLYRGPDVLKNWCPAFCYHLTDLSSSGDMELVGAVWLQAIMAAPNRDRVAREHRAGPRREVLRVCPGGVREYRLIDPEARWAEVYRLTDAHYRPAFSGAEGEYRSEVLPGFWLRVEWLWQRPLPKVVDVLRELGVL